MFYWMHIYINGEKKTECFKQVEKKKKKKKKKKKVAPHGAVCTSFTAAKSGQHKQ